MRSLVGSEVVDEVELLAHLPGLLAEVVVVPPLLLLLPLTRCPTLIRLAAEAAVSFLAVLQSPTGGCQLAPLAG